MWSALIMTTSSSVSMTLIRGTCGVAIPLISFLICSTVLCTSSVAVVEDDHGVGLDGGHGHSLSP